MDPQQVSRNRGTYAPEFHYPSNMMQGMDMQLPPIGGGGGNHDGRGTYDSGSAAAAAAAAQHHRASIGGHSPRIGQSPQQGHPAMFSQTHGYAGGYGGAFGAGPQPGSHHGYQQQPPHQPQQQQQQQAHQQQQQQAPTQQQQQQQHMYGAYGQPAHLQQHASSPHQHYSHVPGSSIGLGAPGQFPGGPMMGGTDMYGHPSYTHVHHGGHHGVPGGYGSNFHVMPHMQGAPNVVMPGQQHLGSMSTSPMSAMHPQQTQSQVGPARQGKQPGQRGRKKKDQSANAGAATTAAPSLIAPPAAAANISAVPPMSPQGKPSKGSAARHHPYGDAEPKGPKKKEKEPPKPAVLKSHLKPPKQAPSAWQVYFTEELQKMKQESPGERLNVAHVAKDAGQRYAALPEEKKKEFQRKSHEAKAEWEREMEKWKQTLTPEDIKQENMFRTAQRKAGKSRKGNLKDPNAPKKPLSAYFLFLRAIRADPALTESVFEGEQETTKQSVLAASKWRSLPDSEKQPYLEKAEADKTEYERLRREYETLHGVSSAPRQESKAGKGSKLGQIPHDDDDDDDEDEDHVDGSHVLGVAGHNPVDSDHFKIDAPFHDDHFIGAPLDDHFAAAGGDHLKPEDF